VNDPFFCTVPLSAKNAAELVNSLRRRRLAAAGCELADAEQAARRSGVNLNELSPDEQFIDRLRRLGEQKAAEGKPVIKALLDAADRGIETARFGNWPRHLQEEAYRALGEIP
jgi:hypothetical protein